MREESNALKVLRSIGIEPAIDRNMLCNSLSFEIDESSEQWPKQSALIKQWNAQESIQTIFTATECEKARHLEIAPQWRNGYPQPEDGFGYLSESYDLTNYCAECGIGAKQKSPFRIRGEPKWGRRQIFALNWVEDEFFVRREVWNLVFQPFGIGCWPVVHHRSGEVLTTVVQLQVESDASARIHCRDQDPASVYCPTCNRAKYLPISRGRFPPLQSPAGIPIQKTREYFGSGASAWQATIVAAELFKAFGAAKLRGANFTPVDDFV